MTTDADLHARGAATLLGSPVYAAVGFRDLGRILELVPPTKEPGAAA